MKKKMHRRAFAVFLTYAYEYILNMRKHSLKKKKSLKEFLSLLFLYMFFPSACQSGWACVFLWGGYKIRNRSVNGHVDFFSTFLWWIRRSCLNVLLCVKFVKWSSVRVRAKKKKKKLTATFTVPFPPQYFFQITSLLEYSEEKPLYCLWRM